MSKVHLSVCVATGDLYGFSVVVNNSGTISDVGSYRVEKDVKVVEIGLFAFVVALNFDVLAGIVLFSRNRGNPRP